MIASVDTEVGDILQYLLPSGDEVIGAPGTGLVARVRGPIDPVRVEAVIHEHDLHVRAWWCKARLQHTAGAIVRVRPDGIHCAVLYDCAEMLDATFEELRRRAA